MLAPEKTTIKLNIFSSVQALWWERGEKKHFEESSRELVSCTIQF